MFGSDTLDIAIGLVLIFLMMSIIMTAVQEALEGWLKTRATHLENALVQLLHAEAGGPEQRDAVLQTFYGHPLVFAMYKGNDAVGRGKGPTYLPRETFSAAIIDLLERPDPPLPAGLQDAYAGLKAIAGKDVGRLRREVEGWYDGAMDRASGWFKRRTQRNLFFMGLLAALTLNINAVSIAQYLNVNKPQREHLMALATRVQGAGAEALSRADEQKRFESDIYGIGMPVGWNSAARRWTLREIYPPEGAGPATGLTLAMGALGLVFGYVMTALAVMLGAPFWFDILNRLMVIRSTVKPKEKSPDEPSQDGGRDKTPTR